MLRARSAVIGLALVALVAGCGSDGHAAQRSASAAAASSSAAAAAATRVADKAQLTTWLTKEQAAVTLAGQFGASMSTAATETATQQAALTLSCNAANEARAGAAAFPLDAAKRLSVQPAAGDLARLSDSLTQVASFCTLYDAGLQSELKVEADYAAFSQTYFYSGTIIVGGTRHTCSSLCLTPDISRYPAAADALQLGATEAATMTSAFNSGPAPFPGAGWGQLWAALGQRLIRFATFDTGYVAALRAQSAAAVASNRQEWAAYANSSDTAINQQIAALGLFPATIVNGYAATGSVAAQFAYYGRYQLGVAAADTANVMVTISTAVR